jgi:hypothetical protein
VGNVIVPNSWVEGRAPRTSAMDKPTTRDTDKRIWDMGTFLREERGDANG